MRCTTLLAVIVALKLLGNAQSFVLPDVKISSKVKVGQSSSLFSSNSDIDSSDLRRIKGRPIEDDNLYAVLEARPSDSHEVLKRKYQALCKMLHPDSQHLRADAAKFSELVNAWKVLGDPKERLRYDRSRKANELAESVVNIFEFGFRSAVEKGVPFLAKTTAAAAQTTAAAVESTSKTVQDVSTAASNTMQDVGEQLERRRERMALEQRKKEIEQRASRESARVKQLNAERESIVSGDPSTRLVDLRKRADLTPAQAMRILEKLNDMNASAEQTKGTSAASGLTNDIKKFEAVAKSFAEKIALQEEREIQRQAAILERENAALREKEAIAALEEAKRQVEFARKELASAKKEEARAVKDEKICGDDAKFATKLLKQQEEMVRNKLLLKEEEILKMKAQDLYVESSSAFGLAQSLELDAKELSKEIEEALRREKERAK